MHKAFIRILDREVGLKLLLGQSNCCRIVFILHISSIYKVLLVLGNLLIQMENEFGSPFG